MNLNANPMDAVGIPTVISSATSVRNSLNYTICWIPRAFLLVLSYDLLEDRCIADVISGIIWSFYYIRQIDSMLPCVCSVLEYRRQNVVRTSVTHSPNGSCATFLFLPHLTSSVIYYWTYARQPGIYLLNTYPKTTLNRETDLSHFIPGDIAIKHSNLGGTKPSKNRHAESVQEHARFATHRPE